MTIQEIQTACTRTTEALDRGALKTAFDTLQGLIAGSQTYTSVRFLGDHYFIDGRENFICALAVGLF